jgi:hypothetical protein
MLLAITFTMKMLWNRLQLLREDDRGMTTETIVVTALLVTLALGAVALIANAVTGRAGRVANDINGGG